MAALRLLSQKRSQGTMMQLNSTLSRKSQMVLPYPFEHKCKRTERVDMFQTQISLKDGQCFLIVTSDKQANQ